MSEPVSPSSQVVSFHYRFLRLFATRTFGAIRWPNVVRDE
jgi:hypothetical protein